MVSPFQRLIPALIRQRILAHTSREEIDRSCAALIVKICEPIFNITYESELYFDFHSRFESWNDVIMFDRRITFCDL